MNEETISRLGQLNRTFYSSFSDHFSDSRKNPWPGWSHVIDRLELTGPLRVLDIGCGNGRFARFLENRLARPGSKNTSSVRYTGIDASEALLAHARKIALPFEARFLQMDLIADDLRTLLDGPFDLIAVFGLVHHLPSFDLRKSILTALAEVARGMLAIAFWRFGVHQRFRAKCVSWSEYNQYAHLPIDEEQLEPNDLLLRWDRGGRGYRYCHFVDDEEEERLIAAIPLQVVDQFDADGKTNDLNRYVLMSPGQ